MVAVACTVMSGITGTVFTGNWGTGITGIELVVKGAVAGLTAEQFDAIASVEMVEAVGERWWGAYLDCIARNLKPGGRAAL